MALYDLFMKWTDHIAVALKSAGASQIEGCILKLPSPVLQRLLHKLSLALSTRMRCLVTAHVYAKMISIPQAYWKNQAPTYFLLFRELKCVEWIHLMHPLKSAEGCSFPIEMHPTTDSVIC